MTKKNDLPDPDDPVDSRHAENLLELADAVEAVHAAADSAAHADLHAVGLHAADLDEEKSLEKNS